MQRTMVYLDTDAEFVENAKTGYLDFKGTAITEGRHNKVWYDRAELEAGEIGGAYRMMADHSHSVWDVIGKVNKVEFSEAVELPSGDEVPGWIFEADVRDDKAIPKVKADLWRGVSVGVWADIVKNEDEDAPEERRLLAKNLQLDHIGFVTDPADKNAGLTKIVNSLLSPNEVHEEETKMSDEEPAEEVPEEVTEIAGEAAEVEVLEEVAESEEPASTDETGSDESVEEETETPEAEELVEENIETDLEAELKALKEQLAAYEDAEAKRQADLAAEEETRRVGLIESIVAMDKTAKPETFEDVDAEALQKVHDFMANKTMPASKGVIDTKENVVSQAPRKGGDRIKQLFGELPENKALEILIETVMTRKLHD